MIILRAEGLNKTYRTGITSVRAIRDVNISVKQGEFIAIMGPSGSGKSTLLNLLGGLDEPDSGKVFIDDKDIHQMKDKQCSIFRRRKIGFIFQFYNLIPVITVAENILLPLQLDNRYIDRKYFKEITELLKIRNICSCFPGYLSGGQMQTVAIARALITKPSIILADEPTGNLDTKTSKEVLKLLQLSAKRYNQTVIMITHDHNIAENADRIINIVDGEIVGENLC